MIGDKREITIYLGTVKGQCSRKPENVLTS